MNVWKRSSSAVQEVCILVQRHDTTRRHYEKHEIAIMNPPPRLLASRSNAVLALVAAAVAD